MKLNDTHLILLNNASQRANGSIMPLPDALVQADDRSRRAISALIKNHLVEEGEVTDATSAWRHEGKTPVGARITQAGLAAIGVEPSTAERANNATGEPTVLTNEPQRQTKGDIVLALLSRETGATLDELTTATGWLAHTTRAALTGLRKKGHTIERDKRDGTTFWVVKGV